MFKIAVRSSHRQACSRPRSVSLARSVPAGLLLALSALCSCAHTQSTPAPPGVAIAAATSAAAPVSAQPSPPHAQALQQLETRIRAGEFSNIHSVLVVQGGQTLAEFYFDGEDDMRDGKGSERVQFGPEVLHDARTVTKSVVSLLFGIAQAEGRIGSLDVPVLSYFPEYADLATPERKRIQLRHLLSMTSGLQWDEASLPYSDLRNSQTALDLSRDRIRHVLALPIAQPPGQHFQYIPGQVQVLAEILERVTRTPLDVYADRVLLGPLGIGQHEWVRDERGALFASTGLRLRPRDMAKIGSLLLQRGAWQGRNIVPEAWIAAATSVQAQATPDTQCGTQYGYLFYVGTQCDGDTRTAWIAAIGAGGQRVLVMPTRQLTIIMTAGMYNVPKYREIAFQLTSALLAALPQS